MSTDQASPTMANGGNGAGEIMLFGVRVVVDSMRKSVSLNDLSQYEHRLDSLSSNEKEKEKDVVAVGYASADDATVHHHSSSTATATAASRERKRGVPWTEDEHKLFLLGLQKVGKGDWRGISRNFVKTRTPTQVASHAQKYFLRRSNLNRRRRRSSLFDITTDTVAANPSNDENNGGSQSPPPPAQPAVASMGASSDVSNVRFSVPETTRYPAAPIYSMSFNNPSPVVQDSEMKLVRPMPVLRPMSSKSMGNDFDLNENTSLNDSSSQLSLKLSLSMSPDLAMAKSSSSSSSSRRSAFQVMQGFGNNGDSIISVA